MAGENVAKTGTIYYDRVGNGVTTSSVALGTYEGNVTVEVAEEEAARNGQTEVAVDAESIGAAYNLTFERVHFASKPIIEELFGIPSTLVSNGTFDSNTTGWTASNANLSSTSGGKSGNCLQIESTGAAYGWARQTLTVTDGKDYTFNCYYKSDGVIYVAVYISTSLGGGEIYVSGGKGDTGWTFLTKSFTATASTIYIELILLSNAGSQTGHFDEITLFPAGSLQTAASPTADEWDFISTTKPAFKEFLFSYTESDGSKTNQVKVWKGKLPALSIPFSTTDWALADLTIRCIKSSGGSLISFYEAQQ